MKFDVTIRATIRKTICVEAETKEQAIEKAQSEFSAINDDTDEDYNEEIVRIFHVN